jgi:hypothetical protein
MDLLGEIIGDVRETDETARASAVTPPSSVGLPASSSAWTPTRSAMPAPEMILLSVPSTDARRDYRREAMAVRPNRAPHAEIFGCIPGDEPEEELAASIEESS